MSNFLEGILNIFKKWRFEIFHQAEVSTLTMSMYGHTDMKVEIVM